MLRSLRIKNFAIIDDVSIEFEKGFNVFTGETGAGKSIIVNALSYLFKGRSDSSLVTNGFDKAIIEGVFELDDENIKNKLNDQDIDYDGLLIVKRVIGKDNRNSIKVNESSVTLNFLQDLLSSYVDIHSQRDSQLLFEKKNQGLVFDKYCSLSFDEYKEAYNAYLKVLAEYDDLLNNTYNERDIEFFKYDLEELEKADLRLDEVEELEELEKKLKDKEKYTSLLDKSLSIYNDDGGLKENFYELINCLNIDDDSIINIKEQLNDLYYSLDEQMNKLDKLYASFNDEDYNIESIEERLYTYSKLSRKHKMDTKGLLVLLDDLRAKIASFEDRDRVLAEKKNELDKAYNKAFELAKEISNIRKNKAKDLSKAIKQETSDLLLDNCIFEVNIVDKDLSPTGIDDVEFLIAMNKGDTLKPLKNVASGGEMSRLLLALKAVFIRLSNTDLLILDEIDTGVSGKAGMLIGRKIAKIAKNCQVLCISHLSMVATYANSHYYIYKEDDADKTCTRIKKLDEDGIIRELANISNSVVDDNSLAAARDLYNLAKSERNDCL